MFIKVLFFFVIGLKIFFGKEDVQQKGVEVEKQCQEVEKKSFIISKIFIEGCNKEEEKAIKTALSIKENDLINLKTSTISINIKRILNTCDFVDDVQVSYEKIDDNSINIFFSVKKAPLIIGYYLKKIKDDKLKEEIETSIGKKHANSSFLREIKDMIKKKLKEDGEKDYKIFCTNESNDSKKFYGTDEKYIKIDLKKIFHDTDSVDQILSKILSWDNALLKKIFCERYEDAKEIIKQYSLFKNQYSFNSDEVLSEEIIKTIGNNGLLTEIIDIAKKKNLTKIEIIKKDQKDKKLYIRDVSFEGNNFAKIEILRKKINFFTREMSKDLFSCIKKSEISELKNIWDILKFNTIQKSSTTFSEERIEEQKKKILEYYYSNGFINAKIKQIRIDKDEKLKYCDITFIIEEGQRFFINSISFKGNKTFNTKILRSFVGLYEGDIFDLETLKNKIEGTQKNMMMDGLKMLYNNEGFLEAKIKINTSFIKNKVNIVIEIIEGEKSKVGIIKFYGNKNTDDDYFKHYVNMYPGDYFRVNDFAMSQQSLLRSDIVSKESLAVFPIKNEYLENVNDIKCNIEEKLKFNLSGKLESEYVKNACFCNCAPKISFNVLVGNLNLGKFFHLRDKKVRWLGKRHDFNFEVSASPMENYAHISKYKYSLSTGFFLPELFKIGSSDTGLANGFSITQYYGKKITQKDEDEDEDEDETEDDDKNKEVIRSLNFYNKFIWNSFNRKTLIKLGFLDIDYTWNNCCCRTERKRIIDIPISFDIRYSTIDRSFFVTKGIDIFFSVTGCNPIILVIKDQNLVKKMYIKSIAYFAFYFPIFKKNVVFNFSFYLGGGLHFTKKKTHYFALGSGPLDTYFSEGQNSVTTFFLKGIDETNFRLKNLNQQKCKIAFKTNVELRLKIIDTPYFGFYFFGFFNAGNLYWRGDKKNIYEDNRTGFFVWWNPIKYCATGGGFRINLPMIGTLGFHLGFDLQTGQFGGGMTFRQDFEVIF